MEIGDLATRKIHSQTWYYQIMEKYRAGNGLRVDLLCLTTGRVIKCERPRNVRVVKHYYASR